MSVFQGAWKVVCEPLENLVYGSISMFCPPIPFRLPASTSRLCVLNGINSRKELFEASAVQGEIILFGGGQPLGDVLRTGLAPTDFCGETSLSVYLRIRAKGLRQPLPSQEAQSTEGRPAKSPPKEERRI